MSALEMQSKKKQNAHATAQELLHFQKIRKSADRMAKAIHAIYGDNSAVGRRNRGETTDWEIQDALREYIQLTGIKL